MKIILIYTNNATGFNYNLLQLNFFMVLLAFNSTNINVETKHSMILDFKSSLRFFFEKV